MKIAMVGTGYVGLVTGTCFADSGNIVTCVDINAAKVAALNEGKIPIFEPGLEELVVRNAEAGRLLFTTDLASAVKDAELVYLGVGTPQGDDGAADLSALWAVVDGLAPHLKPDAAVVIKSTVPVGTNAQTYARLRELTGRDCHVASNPEFLKEGAAIDDFMKPDRVVVGVRDPKVGEKLRRLYAPFLRTEKPFLVMSPESAELTKYVANAMLATKISFINTMANLTEKLGGDINDVRRGIGHDSRIGFSFLFPGVGYGGSCFPKDVRALEAMFSRAGIDPVMLQAVDVINEAQKRTLLDKINDFYGGDLAGKTFAIWGLAFKPRTDDIREAPALVLIDELLKAGAKVRVHDPEATENVRAAYGDKLSYFDLPLDTLDGADALAINTEWAEFRQPDMNEVKKRLNAPVVFDGRNLYDCTVMRELGFTYYSIGRQTVRP
ncbi:UDP-glucose/GDP-mannose dehydrogenase family protein [Blastopirellula sp. JC732]|uniref:UDP-glucose 6-dehydrogenase n=1 Tax=Blastopirellula sediminis TaxID=2894196 RepID=A0A9X1MMR6_9BACT|nr:UDP-glucose/GDP-mannose dehydrogenase family protein [Blastopirellula sediminis]MCC9606710.1 UDP-glucose/GDP-mannose dehydrogenase family protein [Blastopirellula sediminis]MCC9629993.1 UDP-glucose/GDP-mannose dehydrogenase family protein [Blastopirellula sediminis]